MIRHVHQPAVAPGDRVDISVHGHIEAVEPDGRLLVKYATADGSHAWVRLDPAATGVSVSVAHHTAKEAS